MKKQIKKIIPDTILDAFWAYKTYGYWYAREVLKSKREQHQLEIEYKKLNDPLPENKVIIPPDLELTVIPELKNVYDLYCYRDMPFVREMQGFLTYSKGRQCLVDIGALFADYSLVFTALTGGRAYAVDPSPISHEFMSRVLEINQDQNIQPVHCAVGAESGILRMHFERYHCVDDSVTAGDSENTIEVDVRTLDDLVESWGVTPDAVKLDAEGMELDVIRGGKKLLEGSDVVIFLEIHPSYLESKGQSVAELVHELEAMDYSFYHYDGVLFKDPVKFLSQTEGLNNHRVICSRLPLAK